MLATLSLVAGHPLEGRALPRMYQPAPGVHADAAALCDLIGEHREWLLAQIHRYGGVLFRGFELPEETAFRTVARHYLGELKPYVEGQSPRTNVGDNVYTSTEFPAQFRVTMHNELSYARNPPPWILFFCHTAPTVRGETPIVDCRTVYEKMPADLRTKFETLGVRYVKNMHGQPMGMGKSWMDHFETSDRAVVEAYLTNNDIGFEWLADGSLRTVAQRPGVITHPQTGEKHWFNQANLWHVSNFEPRHQERLLRLFGEDRLPTQAYYGDGSAIPVEELDRVREVLWNEAVFFPWQQGDLLILDNYLVAHGRNSFEGPRRILVAMG